METASHFIVHIAVALVLGLLSFIFTYKPKEIDVTLNMNELKRKYQKWDLFVLVPFFIFLPLLVWLFKLLLQLSAKLLIDDNPRIKYQLYIEDGFWYIPAGFFAFAVVCYPVIMVYKIIFTEIEYAEYTLYSDVRNGYDSKKALRGMTCFFAFCGLVVIFLMSDYYIKIWNFKIEENDFWTTKVKDYDFKQIKKITYVEYSRDGKKDNVINYDPHYHILFSDGNMWDTSYGLHDLKHQPEVTAFLSKRSNIHIDTLGVDPE